METLTRLGIDLEELLLRLKLISCCVIARWPLPPSTHADVGLSHQRHSHH